MSNPSGEELEVLCELSSQEANEQPYKVRFFRVLGTTEILFQTRLRIDKSGAAQFDSQTVPYLTLPAEAFEKLGIRVGDQAVAVDPDTEKVAEAVIGGVHSALGYGSAALAQALELPSDAPEIEKRVICVVFRGGGPSPFAGDAPSPFEQWGGLGRLNGLFPDEFEPIDTVKGCHYRSTEENDEKNPPAGTRT